MIGEMNWVLWPSQVTPNDAIDILQLFPLILQLAQSLEMERQRAGSAETTYSADYHS